MSIVALTNIYDGLKSFVPGEIIEGLTEKEEARLVKLKYAEYVVKDKSAAKKPKKTNI